MRALRAVVAYMDGPDANLVDLRLKLAADCPRVIADKPVDRCGVMYPDRIGR
jgi:hypothetical protein